MTELYRPDWALPAGVQARYSGRAGGVSVAPYDTLNLGDHVGDNPQAVAENRARLLAQLPGCDDIQWLEQVHGIDVAEARPQAPVVCADASVSAAAGVACAVLTADCLPVLFCARDGSRVAAAHAGWRGLAGGILTETLKQFSDPGDVLVFLAPAIGPEAFEVGPEVREAFAWASDACFRAGQGDRLFADIYALAREQLQQAGVTSVMGGTECTFSQPQQYFSYRRDGVTGRQVSLIWRSL